MADGGAPLTSIESVSDVYAYPNSQCCYRLDELGFPGMPARLALLVVYAKDVSVERLVLEDEGETLVDLAGSTAAALWTLNAWLPPPQGRTVEEGWRAMAVMETRVHQTPLRVSGGLRLKVWTGMGSYNVSPRLAVHTIWSKSR